MQAIVQHRYGAPDTVLELQRLERPVVGDGDVLINVHAASVNPADWHIVRASPPIVRLSGYGLRTPKNPVPGTDVAGVVEAVGRNVVGLRLGDEVLGWCRGAFAEFACAAEDHFVPKPVNLSFEEAAAVSLAGTTALQGLRDAGRLQPGQTVLIVGASGGVGTFAVQIAKALGAEVTAVCSTRNVDMVKSIGADHVTDYTQADFTRGEQRYDLIFQLAGTRSPSDCRRALKPKGTLVLISGEGRFGGMDRILKAKVASRFASQRLVTFLVAENKADMLMLGGLIEAGKVVPVIDRMYTLGETPAAIRYVEAGHSRGKVVVTVNGPTAPPPA